MYELKIEQINELASQYGSPFYIFDADLFESNLTRLQVAFTQYYDNVLIGYSYKTNYLPEACKIVKSLNGYAEVVSRLEYELALKIDYDPEHIIFNGPLKRNEDLILALTSGSLVHLDGFYELNLIKSLIKENIINANTIKVGLRININLEDSQGISYTQAGLEKGRFGFSGKDIEKAVRTLTDLGVDIISLHGHSSSSNRSVENFIRISETLCEIRDRFTLNKLEYFDVGGGFFGDVPKELIGREVPSFKDYAQAITKIMLNNEWIRKNKPTLLLEPGVAVSANCLSFYTKIYNQKNITGKSFLTVDGSVYNVKPTMHSFNMPYRHIPNSSSSNDQSQYCKYDIVGSTCMEKDILLKEVSLDSPKENDFIEIKNVGAYTIVMTPPFINLAPAIISVNKSEGKFLLSRSAQSVSQFLECYTI